MNKWWVGALAGGIAVATAVGAMAGYTLIEREPDYAQVVEVMPVQKTIRTPRQECHGAARTASSHCETIYDTHIERQGYDVRYRIGDQEGKVRMGHDPGERIPLRSGQLVLDGRTGTG
jgi:uncharacterized protein YcfJ